MSKELTTKQSTVDLVQSKIKQFQQTGEIAFPDNYSPDNALKLAWLMIQETKDRNKTPVLQSCSKESIANALLSMVIQGLNPVKKQCYFIAKDGKLICDVSYLGEKAKAKSLPEVKDVYEAVYYKDDILKYKIVRGKKEIVDHEQKPENIKNDSIAGAYCVIEKIDGTVITEIMTWEQIQESWKKSQAWDKEKNKWKYLSPHQEQPDQMALRTVIKRACKHFVGTSNDSNLLLQQYRKVETDTVDLEVAEEIEQQANKEPIIIETEIGTKINSLSGEIIEVEAQENNNQPDF